MDDIRTEVVNGKYTDDENSDAFSEYQGTILWPRRSMLYRISFLALLPLFVIFLLGFSSPFWMKKHQVDKYRGHYNLVEKVDVSIGLWRVCEGTDFSDIKDCTTLPNTNSYDMACQSMLCLSLIFTTFSIIFGLYENCATMYDIDDGNEAKTKWPEMNAIAAGVFGLVGVGMYGVTIIQMAREGDGSVDWAFPVTTISVTGFIVCGILMAIANPIHATTQGYPGQIMSLSRQSSLRVREPSIQDRLVVVNDVTIQTSGAPAPSTLYGITGGGPEAKEHQFIPRSDSCLSSHMSSPDLFTASSQAAGAPHGQRGTHVVETHDCQDAYVSTYDASRRNNVKQQIQNKAAQRRSWHFDDRSGAYIVSDLINSRGFNTEVKATREQDGVKPPVPPRRDKLQPQQHSIRPSLTQTLHIIPDESADLMLLDDPIVMAPNKFGRNSKPGSPEIQQKPVAGRSTNPFIADSETASEGQAQNPKILQHSSISNESWESQPWPDPPTESEILEHIAPEGDSPASNVAVQHTNSVPESLQYQPQNYASLSRKPTQDGHTKSSYIKTDDLCSSRPTDAHRGSSKSKPVERQHKSSRKASTKGNPAPESHVPVKQEYDNPLFKSPTPEERRAASFGEDFSLQICDSTSFIHPSPQPPPSYYTVVDTMQSDPASYRRHSSHYSHSPNLDARDAVQQASRPVSSEHGVDAPPAYTRHPRPNKEDTATKKPSASSKDKSKPGKHQNQNGGVKSRPRQVKREHNQRRIGQADVGGTLPQPKPPSPHGTYFGSSPDLVSKSPKVGRRMVASSGPANGGVFEQGDCNRNVSNSRTNTPTEYRSSPYGYDTNRQSPYYASRPASQYAHWGDSDL
ncbi:unnamed protein product [Lymnaea stagnalis]|uniref:Uncharacterized protein n=1 Tax=Lymnaea stagnalis TaxID=6523 RepID=A0AAV2HYY5_LYMST